MKFPCLKISLKKILNNARLINDRCALRGISVVGVTKSIAADIEIVKTLKKAGIDTFGDSRLKNLVKLRNYFGFGQKLVLLRTPMLSECEETVETCDISMQTELKTIKAISDICEVKNKEHKIMLMIELDDKREGISPEDIVYFFGEVLKYCPRITIEGLATNARCISRKKPRLESIEALLKIKKSIASKYNYIVPLISGGNSSIWNYIEDGSMPFGVDEVRIGEAIFIGNETSGYKMIKGAFNDSFILEAEIIEIKKRKGQPFKVIIALGYQDVPSKHLKVQNPCYEITGQSSDHTVLAFKKPDIKFLADENNSSKSVLPGPEIGDKIIFNPDYFGVMFLMSSDFIKKIYLK